MEPSMNRTVLSLAAALTLLATSGCIVAPERRGGVVVEPAVVIAPTYDSPGPGYLWRAHPVYGWGWYHPELGWHRGWR
jgi:hypothetical protein